MRYSAIIPNDVSNGEGVCVSLFVQGCPHHCKGCFNPETWDFNGGYEFSNEWTINEILNDINANGIQRNFCVLGGEPLAQENLETTGYAVDAVRTCYPNIKIYLWTGYTLKEIKKRIEHCINTDDLQYNQLTGILSKINILIDGPFIEEEKDLSLRLRGSKNQHIYVKKNNKWELEE